MTVSDHSWLPKKRSTIIICSTFCYHEGSVRLSVFLLPAPALFMRYRVSCTTVLKIVHWNEPNVIAPNSIYQRTFPHHIWIIRPVARADIEIITGAQDFQWFLDPRWMKTACLTSESELRLAESSLSEAFFFLSFFQWIMCVCMEGLHMEGPCQALKSVTGGIKNKWLMKWLTHRDPLGDVCSLESPRSRQSEHDLRLSWHVLNARPLLVMHVTLYKQLELCHPCLIKWEILPLHNCGSRDICISRRFYSRVSSNHSEPDAQIKIHVLSFRGDR